MKAVRWLPRPAAIGLGALLALLALGGSARAQVTEDWVAQYAGTNAAAVVADGRGNIYVVGSSLPDAAHNYRQDIVLIKYDLNGNQVWVREFDERDDATVGGDIANSVALDPDGNILVAGSSFLSGTPSRNTIVLKYDPAGTLLWKARAGGMGASRVATDAAGNVYAISVTSSTASAADYLILKISPTGSVLWERRYNGPGNYRDQPYGLAVTAAGDVVVTGESWGGATGYDVATLSLTTDGAVRWIRRYNNRTANSTDGGTDVALGPNGEVYVGGMTSTADLGYTDFLLLKYTAQGVPVWIRTYNGPANRGDAIKRVRVDSQGNVIVTGYEQQADFYSDTVTIKYNASGNQLWLNRLNLVTAGDEIPSFMVIGSDDAVYVTGASASRVVTVKYGAGGAQRWVATYDSGPQADRGNGLAIDSGNGVVVAGQPPILTIRYAQTSLR
jgi:uncharacterized delta-60 repeat protein